MRFDPLILFIILALAVSPAWSQGDANDRPNDHRPPPQRGESFEPGGRQGRPHRRPPKPLTEEELDQALEILTELRPELAERLKAAREYHPENPQRIGMMLHREYPRLRHFMKLKKDEPKLFELRLSDMKLQAQTHQLKNKLLEAEHDHQTDQVEALRTQLREKVAEHFDVRQQARQYEVEMLKRRIVELEADLAKHAEEREQLIDRRLEDLLNGRDAPD